VVEFGLSRNIGQRGGGALRGLLAAGSGFVLCGRHFQLCHFPRRHCGRLFFVVFLLLSILTDFALAHPFAVVYIYEVGFALFLVNSRWGRIQPP